MIICVLLHRYISLAFPYLLWEFYKVQFNAILAWWIILIWASRMIDLWMLATAKTHHSSASSLCCCWLALSAQSSIWCSHQHSLKYLMLEDLLVPSIKCVIKQKEKYSNIISYSHFTKPNNIIQYYIFNFLIILYIKWWISSPAALQQKTTLPFWSAMLKVWFELNFVDYFFDRFKMKMKEFLNTIKCSGSYYSESPVKSTKYNSRHHPMSP